MSVIYLDNCATTRCDPDIVALMNRCLLDEYGNPSSVHTLGKRAKHIVNKAAQQVADLFGAEPSEVVFTSGATEANNIALFGCFDFQDRDPTNIVLNRIDHKSTITIAKELARRGVRVKHPQVDHNGLILLDSLEACLDEHTRLVSIAHVNSEIGTVQSLERISQMCRARNILLHIDAAQAAGRIPLSAHNLPTDLMSISAHKFYGPKGIGALYVNSRVAQRLRPLMFGGEQNRLRSGTLPVPLIAGMGLACQKAGNLLVTAHARATVLRHRFIERITEKIPEIRLNSSIACSVPHIVNIQVPGIASEALVTGLADVAISSGSACNSENAAVSYVLLGIGLTPDEANSSIRICFGRDLTDENLDLAADRIIQKIHAIRGAHGNFN